MNGVEVEIGAGGEIFLDPPLGSVRYRVGWGGRGGIKSWSAARCLLIHGASRPLRILCAREWQATIRESVHFLLEEQIGLLGLESCYTVLDSEIRGTNGTEIVYVGLRRNLRNLKGLEGFDLAWIEEGETLSKETMRKLFPSLRKPGSEIWITFNPGEATDPVYERFVTHPPADALVRRFHIRDNPWASKELLDLEAADRASDPEAAANTWDGEPWSRSDAQVLAGKWVIEDFTPGPDWDGPYYGLDFGFARDPSVIVKFWRHNDKLWIEREAGGPGLDNDQLADLIREVVGQEQVTIRADAARPETIHELNRRGLKVIAAPKWDGSVKDGIAHLRTYTQIAIHSRCRGAASEARLWRYKLNDGGEVVPQLVDAHNHRWDAIRYGLATLIRQRPAPRILTYG